MKKLIELVRGESGWSSFAEREVKCIVDWLLRIVYEESLVSDIGRACLMEVGYKSRWWTRCNHVCNKFGLWELVNLLWLNNINKEGMAMLGMKYDRSVWKKTLVARIQEIRNTKYEIVYFKNMIKNKWQKNDNNQNKVNMFMLIRRLQNSNN